MFPTPETELTHILVVADPARSRAWYLDVLGATLYREYGSSVVLSFAGAWLLLVEGGGPTDDKPTVTEISGADLHEADDLGFTRRVPARHRREQPGGGSRPVTGGHGRTRCR